MNVFPIRPTPSTRQILTSSWEAATRRASEVGYLVLAGASAAGWLLSETPDVNQAIARVPTDSEWWKRVVDLLQRVREEEDGQ